MLDEVRWGPRKHFPLFKSRPDFLGEREKNFENFCMIFVEGKKLFCSFSILDTK